MTQQVSFTAIYQDEHKAWKEVQESKKQKEILLRELEETNRVANWLVKHNCSVDPKIQAIQKELSQKIYYLIVNIPLKEGVHSAFAERLGNTDSIKHVVTEIVKERNLNLHNVAKDIGCTLEKMDNFFLFKPTEPQIVNRLCDYFGLDKERYNKRK